MDTMSHKMNIKRTPNSYELTLNGPECKTSEELQSNDDFYSYTQCMRFLEKVSCFAETVWSAHNDCLTLESFSQMYKEYLSMLGGYGTEDGIMKSWFHMWQHLGPGYSMIMNTFGVDSRKVL